MRPYALPRRTQTENRMSILVIGHKNPDTDAICSAIGYAWVLRGNGMQDAEAACCGEINARTQFALKQAGMPHPRLVMDVRPTIGQIARREVITAREDETLFEVYRRMQQHHVRAIPTLGADGQCRGLLTFSRLMELVLPDPNAGAGSRTVDTSLQRIARVLNATFGHAVEPERDEHLQVMVAAMSAKGFTQRMRQLPPAETLIVTGDRPTIQIPAIEYGVRALIVTGGYHLGDELVEMADERGVSVLYSPHDTATTTLLLRSAKLVAPAIQTGIRRFPASALVEQVARDVGGSSQELFPVLDDEGQLAGVFSKSDLVNPKRAQLVLVDHNEYAQAVTGADQAEILEVIDHHRLGGGLSSREPIRFINEPVGSTCTIVTRFLYQRAGVPPPDIGLCLAAGIISDTLNLTSPTTTDTDRRMLGWLAVQIGLDVAKFSESFFDAGSALELYAPADALKMDCKEYTENGWRFTVAQLEELDFVRFVQHQDELEGALADQVRTSGVDFAAVMITDITRHNSLLMIAGDERVKDAIDYPRRGDGLYAMESVVSRKKQLLPHLARTLAALTHG